MKFSFNKISKYLYAIINILIIRDYLIKIML